MSSVWPWRTGAPLSTIIRGNGRRAQAETASRSSSGIYDYDLRRLTLRASRRRRRRCCWRDPMNEIPVTI